jgi:hypothetical protein
MRFSSRSSTNRSRKSLIFTLLKQKCLAIVIRLLYKRVHRIGRYIAMKTKLFQSAVVLVGVILSTISVCADPLNNWHWRNPLPNGNPSPYVAYNLYGIVFANGQFFAVGDDGNELTSPDGTNWIQWVTATTNQLNDIIYVNGQFMAVGANGTVETSTTGTNWALQNSGTTNSLYSVAYGNGEYVAVGFAVIASPDGVTWSQATSGPTYASDVAGSSLGFVAVDGGTNVYFSQNGLTWTTNTSAASGGDQLDKGLVTFAKGKFVIGADLIPLSDPEYVYILTSSDGQNWTTNFNVGEYSSGPYGIAFDYTFFMSGSTNVIAAGICDEPFLLSSSDDVTWSFNTYPKVPTILPGNAGAYGNGLYVIVYKTDKIYTSADTVNWAAQQYSPPAAIGPTSTFYSITYSNGTYVVATSSSFVSSTNGLVYTIESNTPSLSSVITYSNSFVGVGSDGQIYQSGNGLTWTQRNSGTANSLNGVAAGNGLLVAVGNNGAIQTSPTGTIWTSRLSGTSLSLYGVVYSNGLYLAVGQEGTVVTSPDGANWTAQDSGQLNNLLSVTYGSAGFLAVGASGTMLTSPDGVNWTQQNSGTSATLESATFGNGYYLVNGANALVMTSPDGVNWTSRNIGAPGKPTLYGSAFLNGRFDVVGSGGTVIESDPVAPLFDLQIHGKPPQNTFTFFATPGSTFRLVSSPNLVGGAWSTVATFNNTAAITLWTNSAVGGDSTYFRLASP